MSQEVEKLKQDKTCLEKELGETVQRLHVLVDASQGEDKEKQRTLAAQIVSELLEKKLHLEREVRHLRSDRHNGTGLPDDLKVSDL